MIEIPLRRGSPSPLYQQLSAHLERMIRSGALTPGERLPEVDLLLKALV